MEVLGGLERRPSPETEGALWSAIVSFSMYTADNLSIVQVGYQQIHKGVQSTTGDKPALQVEAEP